MDLCYIEKAADIVFRMCQQHPEICPHDYSWIKTRTLENGKEERHYRCGLCGDEIVMEK